MRVIDPGHIYRLRFYDLPPGQEGCYNPLLLQFMKRDKVSHPNGEYPGNVGHYPGTNIQEVLRALIDRVKYLDNQIHCNENDLILMHLRLSLYLLEQRAAARRGGQFIRICIARIEEETTCPVCGHLDCKEHTIQQLAEQLGQRAAEYLMGIDREETK